MIQKVDPFMPIQRKPRPLTGQYGAKYFQRPSVTHGPERHTVQRPSYAAKPRIVDDFMHPPKPQPQPSFPHAQHRPTATEHPAPTARHTPLRHSQPRPERSDKRTHIRARKLPHIVQVSAIIVGAVFVGLFIQSLAFGEIVIAIYALFAFARHIASRTTFALSLMALIGIMLLLLVQGSDSTLSNNFAVYTFLLMAVATVSLGRETRAASQ